MTKDSSSKPPREKLREVTAGDFKIVGERLGGKPGSDYAQLRNAVAAELGLTTRQVGVVRMHVLNGNFPRH